MSRSVQGNGHFPTSAQRNGAKPVLHCITLTFGHGIKTKTRTTCQAVNFFQKAWAILLRSYIRDDFICFHVCSEDLGDGVPPNGYSLDKISRLSILDYWVPSHRRLQEVQPVSIQKICSDSFPDGRINTSLNLSPLSPNGRIKVCHQLGQNLFCSMTM